MDVMILTYVWPSPKIQRMAQNGVSRLRKSSEG